MRKGEGQCSERVLGMVSACISYLVRSFGVFCTVHLVLQGGKACENKLKERERKNSVHCWTIHWANSWWHHVCCFSQSYQKRIQQMRPCCVLKHTFAHSSVLSPNLWQKHPTEQQVWVSYTRREAYPTRCRRPIRMALSRMATDGPQPSLWILQ